MIKSRILVMSDGAIKRPRFLWKTEALKHGADMARVQVWDIFSELFLDSFRTEEEKDWMAELLADSPFSLEELEHILTQEVSPVCSANLSAWPGGEWLMFNPDWLIERCLQKQKAKPFKHQSGSKNKTIFKQVIDTIANLNSETLLKRVERIRSKFVPDESVDSLKLIAIVEHYPTSVCGRTLAIKSGFGCPMILKGDYHDCRLYFEENESIPPGAAKEVKIQFLCPKLVYPKISKEIPYYLWEGKNIAIVQISSVEVTKSSETKPS